MGNQNKKVIIYCFVFLVIFLYNIMLTNKITDNVIKKLKREYTPGPYEPSLNLNNIDSKKTLHEWNEYWMKNVKK